MFGLADDAVAQLGGRKRTVDAADGAEGQVHKVAGQPRGNRKHRLFLTAHEGTTLEEGAAAAGAEGRRTQQQLGAKRMGSPCSFKKALVHAGQNRDAAELGLHRLKLLAGEDAAQLFLWREVQLVLLQDDGAVRVKQEGAVD